MTRLDGIDGSHWQYDAGPVDLDTVHQIPTFWIAWKATQSTTYADPTFARTRTAWTQFTHRGAYHWLSSITDPAAQAEHFLSVVGTLVPGEFAMLDAEEAGITVAKCLAWCRAVEARTRRPVVVYTGAYVTGGTIWQNTELRHSLYGQRPFILAAYISEARARALPGVAAYPWQAWQFSSNGPVAGITGRCDMDRIDNRPAFDLASGLQHTGDDDVRADTFVGNQAGTVARLMEDGHWRPLTDVEYRLLGQPAATIMSDADWAAMGQWTPPVTTIPPVVIPPIVVPPPIIGQMPFKGDLGAGGKLTGTVG